MFRYRGYYYDTETGLYYLQSRYYNPEIGRFINADALIFNGYDFLGHNLYVYCNNNPVNMSDNTGFVPVFLIAGAAILTKATIIHFAQKAVIAALKDIYAKQIVSHWIYGRGKKLIISNDYSWSKYLFANAKIREKIDGYVASAIKSNKLNFDYKNQSVVLAGNGGYLTGYEVLNGSHKDVGGFSARGRLTKRADGRFMVSVWFTFNDTVDPNFKYLSDAVWLIILRSSVLAPWNGRNYIIQINCFISYIY